VESGIHIIEVMDLSGLAESGASEFGFIAAPLKLVGATGSPIRPLALIDA
jgi:kynurenine formamidase